jgi:CRISPR-associated protein Csd1
VRAVEQFLSQPIPREIDALLNPSDPREREVIAEAWFAFVYEPDGGVMCVHEHPDVRAYFEDQLGITNIAARGQCLVTGEADAALAKLHASPKGVPGGSGAGVPLTSVNQPAFQSYGLDAIGCAPISTTATLAIDTALSRLLAEGYLGRDGRPLPTRRILLDRKTVFLFWSRGGAVIDYLSGLDSDDPEKVRELLRSPHVGRPAAVADPSAFYAVVLSGSKGRAVVRTLVESTVADVAASISRHLEATRILRPFGRGEGAYPLRDLRRAIAVLGDSDRLPPNLAADLYAAVLEGRPYPRILFESAVRRMRIDPTGKGAVGRAFPDQVAARCSLVKAYFVRNQGKEVSVSLDAERPDPAYRLGRLLAALDKIQQDALGDVNATMVDRYYGGASSTPAAVFPTLVRRSQHHLSKLRKEKPGLAVVRERLLQEIFSGLDSFARTMPLEDQGLFSLGFYHQRQDFFTKKEA